MSWIITGKESGSLGLLDQYGGAAAAYSLRSLTLYYTGPVVRVRRSNDDAEQDFTATEVSDGTLSAWVGAGNDGFVPTWYDQSGNGRHAEQTTTSNQPKIFDSVTGLVIDRGKPSISFNGSSAFLPYPSTTSLLTSSQNALSIYLSKGAIGYAGDYSGGATQRWYYPLAVSGNYVGGYGSNGGVGAVAIDANSHLFTANASSSNTTFKLYIDGTETYSTGVQNFVASSASFGIGRAGGLTPPNGLWEGVITEHIFYSSDQYNNRAAIEANINNYYSIYS